MKTWPRRLIGLASNAAVVVGVGVGGMLLGKLGIPRAVHWSIFAGAAALSAGLLFFSGLVFNKLDKVLQDTEKFDVSRTQKAYEYGDAMRGRLARWLASSLIALSVSVTVSNILKEKAVTDDRVVIVLGYMCIALALLTGGRLFGAYLSLDKFRLSLLKKMDSDQKRSDALRALRASDVLQDVKSAAPMTVVPRRNAQA